MPETVETDTPKKSKKKLIAIALVVVLAAAGAYTVLGKKKAAVAGAATATVAKPGVIMTESALTVNLSGGHYLQVAPALQLMAGVSTSTLSQDNPQILDAVITAFSGQSMDRLSTSIGIRAAKRRLLRALSAAYPDKIFGVYFTQFVMQ